MSKENGYLVIARKEGEDILIGEDIVISISCILPKQVKVGIKCPKNIKILRAELKGDVKQ